MLKKYNVDVFNKASSTKVNGITIEGQLEFVKNIDCDMQPYSRALLIKAYGYDLEVTKRIFMDIDPDVRIGTVFHYTNLQGIVEKYEVKAIPWDEGYFEVMCNGIY